MSGEGNKENSGDGQRAMRRETSPLSNTKARSRPV